MNVNSDKSLEEIISLIRQSYAEYKFIDIEIKVKGKARSNQQNRALHKWLTMLSTFLNNCGLDMRTVLAHHVDMPWDTKGENAKERLFKPVLQAVSGKESTAKADRKQYNEVYQILSRHFAEKHGVTIPEWPSED